MIIFVIVDGSKNKGVHMDSIEYENMARNILAQYGDPNRLPIDVVKIVEKMGITLNGSDFEDLKKELAKSGQMNGDCILGASIFDANTQKILYRSDYVEFDNDGNLSDKEKKEKLKKGQRFTIAHELAHLLKHKAENSTGYSIDYHKAHDDIPTNEKNDEYKANIFAGELLIPRRLVDAIYSMYIRLDSTPKLSDLAGIFYVSEKIMKARLDFLHKDYLEDL